MSRLIIKLTIDTGDDGYEDVHQDIILDDLIHGRLKDYVVTDYEVEKQLD